MGATIGYLWPEWQTYGWLVAQGMLEGLGIDATLVPEKDQAAMLEAVLRRTSHLAGCIIAYSNNLWAYWVSGVFDKMVHHIRMEWNNKMSPERLVAIGRTSIEQCLIWREDTETANIQTIYAHPQAANQVTKWKQEHAKKAEVKFADSNGAAINLAIEANNPTVVAIGPAFGVRDGVQVLLKWIDNHPGSVTNFALVRNVKRDPLIIQNTTPQQWTILVPKSGPDIAKSLLALSALVSLHGLGIEWIRLRNSLYSGRPIQLAEVYSESREKLLALVADLIAKLPDLQVQVSTWWRTATVSLAGAFEETDYLWPCPVVEVQSKV